MKLRRVVVLVCLAALLGGACGVAPPSVAAAPLPPGFTRSADQRFGFEIGLAPGWKVAQYDAQGSVSYGGPGGVAMVVHFEAAATTQLSTSAAVLLAELTAGEGLPGARVSPGHLAGQPAERVTGQITVGGPAQAIVAYLMIEGSRAWEVAIAGPPEAVTAATAAFDRMVATFRLSGARPTPPPRAAVGLPAPGFPALDRVSGPVVINFFATWCADCRADMPTIARAAAQHRFTLLGVDCCDDQPSGVGSFLKQLGVAGAFRSVTYDQSSSLAQAYGLLGPPTTVFLDRDHVLRQMIAGPVTATSLAQGLRDAGVS
jgi:cytochrome c biogenesis protein CcmG, thiol:disulfide interchange protein DsbE